MNGLVYSLWNVAWELFSDLKVLPKAFEKDSPACNTIHHELSFRKGYKWVLPSAKWAQL